MSNRVVVMADDRTGPSAVAVGRDLAGFLGNWQYQKVTANETPIALDVLGTIDLDANTVYGFRGIVVARYAGASTGAAYLIQGAVKKGAANANVALIGTPLVTAYEDTSGMDLSVTADTTNGRLTLTATGVAATSIVWKAEIYFTKVGAAL